jgi:hypothetical protein
MRLFFPFIILVFLAFAEINSQDFKLPFDLSNFQSTEKKETKQEKTVRATKEKLLQKKVDELTDREVDEYLQEMNLSTMGSIFEKRIRLTQTLAPIQKKVKDDLLFDQTTEQTKEASVIIENAVEGDFMQVDKNRSGVMILRGKVRVKIGKGSIKADSITIDSSKKELYAEGNIQFEDGPITATGDKLIYDTELQRGVIYNTKAKVGTSYFIGKKFKRLDETKFAMELGYFTACNAEVPHYSFKVKRVILDKNQTIIASDFTLKVGDTTVFWLPLFYTSNLESGWLVQAGRNNSQGTFVQTSYAWSDPLSMLSLFSPMGRKVRMDYYEKTGQAVGFEFWKQSPWLNYQLDLGYANFQKYQITSVYEDRFRTSGGIFNSVVTNQVDRGDLCLKAGGKCLITAEELLYGSVSEDGSRRIKDLGRKQEPWHKVNLMANSKKNNADKDGTRNIQLRIENYNRPDYEYEFGYRYQPANTLQSLYTRRFQRSAFFKQSTTWSFDYTESRGDLSLGISAMRNFNYFILSPRDMSGFFPLYDELPKITIQNSTEITKLPYFNSPVYWDINVLSTTRRYYNFPVKQNFPYPLPPDFTSNYDPYGRYKESILRTENLTMGETGFKTTAYLGQYVNFQPGIYYGATKKGFERPDNTTTPSAGDISLDRLFKRDSYQYLRNHHILTIGEPILQLKSTYRRTQAIKPEIRDTAMEMTSDRFSPPSSQDKVHEMEVAVSSNSLEFMDVSLSNIRDMRRFDPSYQPQPQGADRWFFTIFRVNGFYDILEGFNNKKASLLETRRSFYSGIFFNNDFVYHTPKNRSLYNQLTMGYKAGGFKMPLIRRINKFELGGSWYHVYHSALLDNYRVYMQMDILFNRYNGLEIELDSRVTQPWRYTSEVNNQSYFTNFHDSIAMNNNYMLSSNPVYSPTNLQRDLLAGTGAQGQDKKQTTAMNIYRMMVIYKTNLHNFDFKLGYSMDLRSIAGGLSLDNQVNFYDQAVFAIFSFTNIGFGESGTASQFRGRFYRFRKRPFDKDAFRSSYSSQEN